MEIRYQLTFFTQQDRRHGHLEAQGAQQECHWVVTSIADQ